MTEQEMQDQINTLQMKLSYLQTIAGVEIDEDSFDTIQYKYSKASKNEEGSAPEFGSWLGEFKQKYPNYFPTKEEVKVDNKEQKEHKEPVQKDQPKLVTKPKNETQAVVKVEDTFSDADSIASLSPEEFKAKKAQLYAEILRSK